MPGPPPKPTNLRILEGMRGHHRPINENEPQPSVGAPEMPKGMPADARAMWRLLVEELDRMNLITMVDGGALEAACRAVAQARLADREIDRLQRIIKAKKDEEWDYRKLSVQNSLSKKSWHQWKSFCTEFGLTPASRSRLSVPDVPGRGRSRAGSKTDSVETVLCG